MEEMANLVAESALAGRAVLKLRSALSQSQHVGQVERESAPPPSTSPQLADIERVMSRVRTALLSEEATKSVDAAITSILRDPQFTAAWNNANAIIRARTPREELLRPVIDDEPLRSVIGGFRDEVQAIANAWASVVRGVYSHPPRSELLEIDAARLILPTYLDDDRMPVEMWEALRARDAAAVCFIALVEGIDRGASPALLGEYAEGHCRYQRQWLDFLSWAFDLPCPDVVVERQPWAQIFADSKSAERGVDALFAHAKRHPDGFAVGDTTPVKE